MIAPDFLEQTNNLQPDPGELLKRFVGLPEQQIALFHQFLELLERSPKELEQLATLFAVFAENPIALYEKMIGNGRYELLTGSSNPELAQKVADLLQKQLVNTMENDTYVTLFNSGEARPVSETPVKDRHVFLLQTIGPPNPDKDFGELLLMLDAVYRGGAKKITVVIPHLGFGRQDRLPLHGKVVEPLSVATVLKALERYADEFVVLDPHSDQTQAAVEKPFQIVFGSYILIPAIKEYFPLVNAVVLSPDAGGTPRAEAWAKRLSDGKKTIQVASAYKTRDPESGLSKTKDIMGDVLGKDVIIVDDMIDGGTTLVEAAKLAKAKGAERIIAVATHGVFSKDVVEKIQNSPIEKVFVLDTIAAPEAVLQCEKIEVISCAPLLKEAIYRLSHEQDLNDLFVP